MPISQQLLVYTSMESQLVSFHVSFPKSASVLYQEPSLTVLASLTHLNLTTCTNTYCIDSHINNYLYFAYFAQQHAEETSFNGYIFDKQ